MANERPIIDKDELLKEISGTIGKEKVLTLTAIMLEQLFDVADLVELTFYPDKNIAFRAAWLMENLFLTEPLRFMDKTGLLINSFLNIENRSCQRHYLKVLIHLTNAKAHPIIKSKISTTNMEPVAERCFDLLIDPESPEAIKVFACQLAFNLHKRYDWISETLTEQIRILMDGGKPGIRSRGNALLKVLNKEQ